MSIIRGIVLPMVLLGSFGFSASVTLTAKYGKTGGLAGNLNHVGDTVNGRNICPDVNTNANETPGCDMSDDPGLNDNGTPNDPSDDYYEGDMIVRTNDSFEAIAAYSWLGNAGGDEEQVTITGTLPSGKGFIWDGIPGSCSLPESTLSDDGKTITCVRKDFDTNDVGSFAEDLAFAVKVEGDALNGSTPGYVTFKIEAPGADPVTDSTQTANPGDQDKIIVTASPRWNIDKHGGSGYYTTQYGQTNPDTGETGWIIWYNFIIEVDEVDGEQDDPINPSLGNEALEGGADATVTFVDDLSQISPNAVLATWSSGGACDMTHSNSDEPYPTPNADYPDRSVSAPNGPLSITCTQNGSSVSIQVDHIDGTLTHAPTKTRRGALLPVNRKIAAIGTVRVFVPLSDVEAGEDHVADTDDDGVLGTKNCVKDFTPKGISGTRNFNGEEESEKDNCYSYTLYAAKGSWSKTYRRGWSDRPDQRTEWGSETNDWWYPPTDAAIVWGGDGTATPGTMWGTYSIYQNRGGTDIANPSICDVIDTETYEMVLLHEDGSDDPETAIDDGKHAVDIDYGVTETIPEIKVEYAVGYVGTWPPDPDSAGGEAVARECNDTSITWYDTYTEAAQHGAVSKVRMTASSLPAGKYMAMRIKHRARSNYLSSGQPIPNKTLLVNYATYKSSLTDDKYVNNGYIARDADNPHSGGWSGDRLTLQRAKVRIAKTMQPTAVSPGSEATVTLSPSFTVDGPTPQTDEVVIADLLPAGLSYKAGSATGTYDGGTPYGEPTIYSPATDAECNLYAKTLVEDGKPCGTLNGGTGKESILVWNLGQQTTGTVYGDLNFTTIVTIDAPPGVLANYAQIESPADESAPSKRVANANVSNTVPSSLLIVKSVLTPRHEINKESLLNWMEFSVGVRNGSADGLTNLDIIDILPFNGDGNSGSFTFTPSAGTTVDRHRTPATHYSGSFEFDSMSFDENDQCDASNITYWFTNATGPLDISPVASSNTDNNGDPTSIWCQGTPTGPNASCGFTKADVTAVRIRGVDMDASGTCFLNLKYATRDNADEDIYSNTAGAKAIGVTNAVLSNTVSAKVYASSIGDFVWIDKNADGIQDADEEGVAEVTVRLYDASGTLVAETQTDPQGRYEFTNLIHGDYVVEVVPPEGYYLTPKNQGGDESLDSDIDPDTNKTETFTLGEDEENMDIDAGLYTVGISGTVYDDGNGDGNINGTPISEPGGTQLYVTLIDGQGNVLASKPVAADGSYEFTHEDGVEPNKDYKVVLSTTADSSQPNLPVDWNNADGEQPNNSGTGNDGSADGILNTHVGMTPSTDNDFGINHKPMAQDANEPAQLNPGGDTQVPVPALSVSDMEDGTPTTITIKDLPDNATLYYDGQPVVAGQIIENYDPSKLSVDPSDGDQTVVFHYTATDAAGVESDPATVTMPFREITLSGHIFDDGDGDGNVNGAPINRPEGIQLYVTLVDTQGNAVATKAVNNDGTYLFTTADGLERDADYTLVLSREANATQPSLPENWNNTGEVRENPGTGKDGAADGRLSVSTSDLTVNDTVSPDNDFGINRKPVAEDRTEPAQPNPSGDTQYPVPELPVSDLEDGTPTTITIVTLPDPSTGILYYDGQPVDAGQVIENYDPDKLTVDPADGNQNVVFTYTTTDAAGATSDPATVTMPFLGEMHLGDRVWMDENGNGVQDRGETGVAGVTVTLLDEQGNVVETTTTDDDGHYQFTITTPGNYRVQFDDSHYYTGSCSACDDEHDSNVHAHDNVTDIISLDWGDENLSIDAGVTPTAHIGDYFWIDENKNGRQDPGEMGVENALVELLDENGNPVLDEQGNPITTRTDENGKYGFDVPPGRYKVRFTIPKKYRDDGYVFTGADAADDTADSDVGSDGIITVAIDAAAGENKITLDAGINCGCDSDKVGGDGGSAMGRAWGLLMVLLTMGLGWLAVRRREEEMMMRKEER